MLENGLEKVLVRDTDEFERLQWQLVNEVAEHSKT